MSGSEPVVKSSWELETAIHDDRLRQQRDDAKKRAAGNLADYETFKNLVSVAHLRPLQAQVAVDRSAGGAAWGFSAAGEGPPPEEARALERTVPASPASTSAEFEKVWLRVAGSDRAKWGYLAACSAAALPRLFKVEMSGPLMGDMVSTLTRLERAGGTGEAGFHAACLATLRAITETGRFALNRALLGKGKLEELRELLDSIAARGEEHQESVDRLRRAYGLKKK